MSTHEIAPEGPKELDRTETYAAQRPLFIDDGFHPGWGMGDIPDLIGGRQLLRQISSSRGFSNKTPDTVTLGDVAEEIAGNCQAAHIAPSATAMLKALREQMQRTRQDTKELKSDFSIIEKAIDTVAAPVKAEITELYQALAERARSIIALEELYVIGADPSLANAHADDINYGRELTDEWGARLTGVHIDPQSGIYELPRVRPVVEGVDGTIGIMPGDYLRLYRVGTFEGNAPSYIKPFYTFLPLDQWTPEQLRDAARDKVPNGAEDEMNWGVWRSKPTRRGPYRFPETHQA